MAIEIERKFLVLNEGWRSAADAGAEYAQGYLGLPGRASVRVRLEASVGKLNIKEAVVGSRRLEFEYTIPEADARQLLGLASGGVVYKRRYHVAITGHVFEIDEFQGDNAGLVVAEIELPHEDADFPRPAWLGQEVTHDLRYYNSSLAEHPYCRWPDGQ